MLARRNAYRELASMQDVLNRFFDEGFSSDLSTALMNNSLAMDVVENTDEFVVKATVPGINPEDLDVSYTGDTLTIKGEIKDEKVDEKSQYHLRERRYGSFCRSVTLPNRINADKIDANFENGILTLHLPKAEEVKPKRISITPHNLIDAKAKEKK
jgi:HSP20 family protein